MKILYVIDTQRKNSTNTTLLQNQNMQEKNKKQRAMKPHKKKELPGSSIR